MMRTRRDVTIVCKMLSGLGRMDRNRLFDTQGEEARGKI